MDASQLTQVEALCNALYVGRNSEQRAEAQQQLLTLQSTADFIPQCQFILDNSVLPYAQLVASSSLENLVTQFWNNFSQVIRYHPYLLYEITPRHNTHWTGPKNRNSQLCAELSRVKRT